VNELERYFSLNIIDYTQINNVDKNHLSVLFIATGGVEKLVAHCIEQLPRPTIMLADGIKTHWLQPWKYQAGYAVGD